MLRGKDRMIAHRSLPAVVRNDSRSQPFGNEILGMPAKFCRAFLFGIGSVFGRKLESGPKS